MDAERLVQQIADLVIKKLKNEGYIHKRKVLQTPSISNDTLAFIQNILDLSQVYWYNKYIPIRAITKDQIMYLLKENSLPPITSAALTMYLKRQGIEPYASPESSDPRRRFFIGGKQTVCYVLDNSLQDTLEILMELQKLQDKISF